MKDVFQQSYVDGIVELLEVDFTAGDGPVMYLCNASATDKDIRYGGKLYVPVPYAADGWNQALYGSLPRPTLSIAMTTSLAAIILQWATDVDTPIYVRRLRTLAKYLDGEPEATTANRWPDEHYVVVMVLNLNAQHVELQLASVLDISHRQIPGRQCLRDVCFFTYRSYKNGAFDYTNANCPYVGTSYFTDVGDATTDPRLDVCSKNLVSGCQKRFPTGDIPFQGFPGMQK